MGGGRAIFPNGAKRATSHLSKKTAKIIEKLQRQQEIVSNNIANTLSTQYTHETSYRLIVQSF